MELVGVEELGVQEQVPGAPLVDRDQGADDGDAGDHGQHPAEQGRVHCTVVSSANMTANGTRKKPMFSIAFGTSSE